MKWLEESIMVKRGVGAGRKPVTHHLTEEMQKEFHYTIGPYSTHKMARSWSMVPRKGM